MNKSIYIATLAGGPVVGAYIGQTWGELGGWMGAGIGLIIACWAVIKKI